jgi:uncharacterized protein (DUF302 family)
MTLNSHAFMKWTSPTDVPTTTRAIAQKLETAGVTIFATIDQQAFARAAGLDMAPLTEILFGNPRAGTPLMQADPLAAFDLPLKVLIMQQDNEPTEVLMLKSETFADRYGSAKLASQVIGGGAALIEAALAIMGS